MNLISVKANFNRPLLCMTYALFSYLTWNLDGRSSCTMYEADFIRSRRYFDTIHPSFPIVDETNFLSRGNDIPVAQELSGLRYAMWAHAAALSPIYSYLKERSYQQARECIENLDMEISGRSVTVAALQIHVLLALYEFKQTLYFELGLL